MGRPREHDDHTAAALLDAAERTVQESGIGTLSVRGVAADVGTTTRAVYSLFGSKDGLLSGLGVRAFELLREGLEALPETDDPGADLVEAGLMFRRFAIEHPSLFAIGIQRAVATPAVRRAGFEALEVLKRRIGRLEGHLGTRTVDGATLQFHALCEGLATLELRGTYPKPVGDRMWREALGALVAGFASG